MKIYFDYQAFYGQNVGGISRVHFNLIKELNRQNKVKVTLFTIFSFNSYLIEGDIVSKFIFLKSLKLFGFLKKYRRLVTRKFTNLILSFHPPDFFIPTYYDCYFLKSLGKTQMVLVLHDLIHELFSGQFVDSSKIIANKKQLIFASTLIIAPSQCTKNDILKFYPELPLDKVHVVHWASSMPRLSNNLFIHNKQKIILFIGKRDTYKNFNWFINTISEWLLINDFVINCVGGGSFSEIETEIFKRLNVSNLIFQYNLSDYNLSLLYSQSFVTIVPSLYEGFCLPIIEAMSCGCPVIYSDSSCLPEIAGSAGLKFKENEKYSLLNKVNILLTDNSIYQTQVNLGILRSKEFSWEQTVIKVQRILEKNYI